LRVTVAKATDGIVFASVKNLHPLGAEVLQTLC